MADISELKVQLTLTISELRDLVALVNLATDAILAAEQEVPAVVDDVSGLYFELMEELKDGIYGRFQPE